MGVARLSSTPAEIDARSLRSLDRIQRFIRSAFWLFRGYFVSWFRIVPDAGSWKRWVYLVAFNLDTGLAIISYASSGQGGIDGCVLRISSARSQNYCDYKQYQKCSSVPNHSGYLLLFNVRRTMKGQQLRSNLLYPLVRSYFLVFR